MPCPCYHLTWDVFCDFPQCLQWMLWQYLLLSHDYILPNPNPFTKYDKSHSVCIWITLSTLQHEITLLKSSYRSTERKTCHCHNRYWESALYENKSLMWEKRHKMVSRIKNDNLNFQHSENSKTAEFEKFNICTNPHTFQVLWVYCSFLLKWSNRNVRKRGW